MRINTNLSALNAYRNLNMTDSRLNQSLERLSSGLRINRAADDAAGLAISEKMRGQIRGLNQATRNAQDGISLMQTAEGALNEAHSILQRMRELAVQAASDTLTSSDRIEIQREIDQLKGEMDRIASSTEFNTKKLLDGSSAALTSTSDLNTKVFMRGGLRTVDQFGQKAVGGGNYKLKIDAIAGKGEVQKTDIMKVKHEKNVNEIEGTNGGLRAVMRYAIDADEYTSGITIELNATADGSLEATFDSGNATVTVDFDPNEHTVKDIYDELRDFTGSITLADGVLSSGATLEFNELFDFQLIDGAMDVDTAGGTTSDIADVGWFIGNVASTETEIGDIDRFWDANGNFLAEDPQTINIVQGNGKQASITIFGSDTIENIEEKLNRAIHNDLGQRDFSNESDAYVKYVSEVAADQEDNGGNFSVGGTFVIQSAVTGKDGELRFSGNEGIINALSLTTLQESEENEFTVSVTDAHDGEVVAQNERIVGNMLVGVVHENVDVKFDPMAGVKVVTQDDGNFEWEGSEENGGDPSEIFVHLSDNTMVFHIGANPLQDVGAAIGDMSSDALGIDNILVSNRESANRALSQIDYAIANVSSERAKLGAVQNRLEHTINNLTVAAENLTAAESRVRDLDFALEMVEFTRNQIMTQAGTSMLAQANQKPQSVLMLLQ